MSEIYKIIEAIAATPKLTEKEAILRSTIGTDQEELVKAVFKATYDESINYWVKEFPQPESYASSIHILDALDLIEQLSDRTFTGNAAILALTGWSGELSEQDAIIMDRVIKRDLRCGATGTMANKVWPGLIDTVPYMRCSPFNEKNLKSIKFPCFSQTKEDGLYIDIIVTNKVKYQTRTGQKLLLNEVSRDNSLMDLRGQGDYVLMGEALILNDDGSYMSRKEGNGILNSDEIPMDKVVFVLWDCVPYVDWLAGKSTVPYDARFSDLGSVLAFAPSNFRKIDTIVANSIEDVIEHFKKNVELDREGTVVKNFQGLWKDGTSKDQVKVKIIFSCELLIVDAKEGKGKHAGKLGAFLARSSDGLVEVWVGGGYKDPERVKFWKEKDQMIGSSIMEVLGNDLITDRNRAYIYSIFLPRCSEVRKDKTTADSLDRIREQRNACVNVLRAIGR